NTPPMIAPVAPPTIAPPTGSCAAASCIGTARAMARQAEVRNARINPALLLTEFRFHIEMRPNGGGQWDATARLPFLGPNLGPKLTRTRQNREKQDGKPKQDFQIKSNKVG